MGPFRLTLGKKKKKRTTDDKGEVTCVSGWRVWGVPVPSPRWGCKPKTALEKQKNKVLFKMNKCKWEIADINVFILVNNGS